MVVIVSFVFDLFVFVNSVVYSVMWDWCLRLFIYVLIIDMGYCVWAFVFVDCLVLVMVDVGLLLFMLVMLSC